MIKRIHYHDLSTQNNLMQKLSGEKSQRFFSFFGELVSGAILESKKD